MSSKNISDLTEFWSNPLPKSEKKFKNDPNSLLRPVLDSSWKTAVRNYD